MTSPARLCARTGSAPCRVVVVSILVAGCADLYSGPTARGLGEGGPANSSPEAGATGAGSGGAGGTGGQGGSSAGGARGGSADVAAELGAAPRDAGAGEDVAAAADAGAPCGDASCQRMTAVEVTVGGFHACARSVTGSVHCWGANDHWQLGDPPRDPQAFSQFVATDPGCPCLPSKRTGPGAPAATKEHRCDVPPL